MANNIGEPGSGSTDFILYHAMDGSACAYSPSTGLWMFIDGSTSFDYSDYPGAPITGFARVAQTLNNLWTSVSCMGRFCSGYVRGGSGSGIRG